mmetsp:Transcript_16959/g.36507  ORF Transcript_16959/g.36507 Transcript_16959/m.36507 type:complete len:330 (+) Transcript_16959:356-1345(+)
MSQAAEVRFIKGDIPVAPRKTCVDVLRKIYREIKDVPDKSIEEKRLALAKAFKRAMEDIMTGPWHVLVGATIGFACKKRSSSLAFFQVAEEGVGLLMVIVWRSPSFEELPDFTDIGLVRVTHQGCRNSMFTQVHPPPEEKDTEPCKVADVVKCHTLKIGLDDSQALAQSLRKHLTLHFGTIWHVMVGPDFYLQVPSDAMNFIDVRAKGYRIAAYQHREPSPDGDGFTFEAFVKVLPYLLAAVMCVGFIFIYSICKHEAEPDEWEIMRIGRNRFCHPEAEMQMQVLGFLAVASVAARRIIERMCAHIEPPKPNVPKDPDPVELFGKEKCS